MAISLAFSDIINVWSPRTWHCSCGNSSPLNLHSLQQVAFLPQTCCRLILQRCSKQKESSCFCKKPLLIETFLGCLLPLEAHCKTDKGEETGVRFRHGFLCLGNNGSHQASRGVPVCSCLFAFRSQFQHFFCFRLFSQQTHRLISYFALCVLAGDGER